MRSRFSPTPAAANAPQRTAHETQECPGMEEVAAERGVNNNAGSHLYVGKAANPFGLNPVYTRRMRRTMVEAVGCGVLSGIGVTIAAVLTMTDAHWSVPAMAGVASGYLLITSISAARDLLARQDSDRERAQSWREAHELGELESFALRCELSAARQEANMIYTAYLFSAAADERAAPAGGVSGAKSAPPADVLFMNPHKPKAVH